MVKLTGVLSHLGKKKILIVGDLMLDTYTIGKARRISPEAPVAVVNVIKEEHRPGGAGNVALNLVSMGSEVVVLGRVGEDLHGEFLIKEIAKEGVDTCGIVMQKGYRTPVKNRIIADNQQIVRVDHEEITALPEMLEEEICKRLAHVMAGVHVVAVSDYGKGFLTRSLLAAIIDYAKSRGIPVVADPKGVDFNKYSGATVIKPNLSEAYNAAALPADATLDQVAEKVLHLSQAEVLMITRSEQGISLFHKDGKRDDFPVRVREVKDVTGAGDTVLAMLTCGLANKLSLSEAVLLSNVAAGIAIERMGCARVTLGDLARRLLHFDVENKVFDEEHIFALEKALEGRKYVVLSLSGSSGLTSAIYNSIRKLSESPHHDLLVYVRDADPDQEFINILAALHDVDFIFVSGEGLNSLCERQSPSDLYSLNDKGLQKVQDVVGIS